MSACLDIQKYAVLAPIQNKPFYSCDIQSAIFIEAHRLYKKMHKYLFKMLSKLIITRKAMRNNKRAKTSFLNSIKTMILSSYTTFDTWISKASITWSNFAEKKCYAQSATCFLSSE